MVRSIRNGLIAVTLGMVALVAAERLIAVALPPVAALALSVWILSAVLERGSRGRR